MIIQFMFADGSIGFAFEDHWLGFFFVGASLNKLAFNMHPSVLILLYIEALIAFVGI
jgi:hypothetical protein